MASVTTKGRKFERTPEQVAEDEALRGRLESRPSADELIASGEISEESVPRGGHRELRRLALALKAERNRLGWGLIEAGERSGLSGPVLSALETGRTVNPTLNTLYRYALALGVTIRMTVEPATSTPTIWCMHCKHAFRAGIPAGGMVKSGANPVHQVECPRCKHPSKFVPIGDPQGRGWVEGMPMATEVED